MSVSQNEPVVNLPFLYFTGFQLAWGSNTTLTVASGQCRDSANVYDMSVSTASTTINAATNGLNGLDTGSLAASTFYYVYVIGDATGFKPTGFILSTNAPSTGPLLPSGYSIFRRAGQVKTDGSSHFLLFYQTGTKAERTYYYDTPISVLSAGTSATFLAVSLAAAVTAVNVLPVYLRASYTPNAAGNAFSLRPTGSSVSAANAPVVISAEVMSQAQKYAPIKIIPQTATGNLSIDYVVNASDSLTLGVVGYDDYV